jgi:hypothetical protein
MTKIIIINKYAIINCKNISNLTSGNIYKKAGFRTENDFQLIHTWNYNNQFINLYGKVNGKSNNINKYELPPPIDTNLYYGSLTFIKYTDKDPISSLIDFTEDDFTIFIESLFGGFESLHNTDSEDDNQPELDYIDTKNLTKEGYIKDEFIVSDGSSSKELTSDEEEFYYDSELQYESYSDSDSDEET